MSKPIGTVKGLFAGITTLLDGSFVEDKKVSFSTVTANKVAVTGVAVTALDKAGRTATSSSIKFAFEPVEGIKVSKLEFNKLGRIDVEAELKTVGDYGKIILNVGTGASGLNPLEGKAYDDTGSVAFEYAEPNTTVNVAVDAVNYNPSLTFLHTYEGLVGGFEVSYNVKDNKLTEKLLAFGYRGDNFLTAAKASFASNTIEVGHHHQISPELSIGAVALHTLSSTDKNGKPTEFNSALSVGAKYAVDADTTVNVKLDHTRNLKLNVIRALRPGVELTVSSLFDANQNIKSTGFGFNFNF